MELRTLDDNCQPLAVLENYNSLIWTERYGPAGDFELQSNTVEATLQSLPLESMIGLRESTVPMIVETHKIEKPINGPPLLTVTGRSYESILERRISVNGLPAATTRTPWIMGAATESDAAYQVMRMVLGDIDRYRGNTLVLPAVAPIVANDAIPDLNLTLPSDFVSAQSVEVYSATKAYSIGTFVTYNGQVWQAVRVSTGVTPPGSAPVSWTLMTGQSIYTIDADYLYNTVQNLITMRHHGIKSVLPGPSQTSCSIEIYNGGNLTGEGPNSDPQHVVVFDARYDQFDDATYLLSEQGSTNVAYVYDATGSQQVLKTAGPEPLGLDRRVLLVDTDSSNSSNSPDTRNSRGLIQLYQYNETALFDGQISVQIADLYNTADGYSLGDIILLNGEYGLSEKVRVTEFIRSVDSTGEKAYPTFEVVSE